MATSRFKICWNDPRQIPTPYLVAWIIQCFALATMAGFTGYKGIIDLTLLFGTMAGFSALILICILIRYLYVRKRLTTVTMV